MASISSAPWNSHPRVRTLPLLLRVNVCLKFQSGTTSADLVATGKGIQLAMGPGSPSYPDRVLYYPL